MPSVGRTKVDGLLSLVDEERVVCPVSAIEISGLPFVVDNSHFMKDHIKIAKNLKYLLNKICYLNCQDRNNIARNRLDVMQAYQKKFGVYSIPVAGPKLYKHKQEMCFTYPTSPTYFKN